MESRVLMCLIFAVTIAIVDCNLEGDALASWKASLTDPNNVLQSWDPTLVNPCTWDVANSGLQGPLVPELGLLSNLKYLKVSGNNISGEIPTAIGNLTNLIRLGLDRNQLSGEIPASLGKLASLKFLNLNSNFLVGTIPTEVFELLGWGNLRIL
ncbi:hypothetical protein Tsubulata_022768 [Turnera subulata]|uniref:Leucine-rich repeat-containing N-terminal plant-type domain-containing protein n=1 Tax=Turnera subulata TaxID=218843 RepID=A0A9Q0GB84_9ROSI|nr:hypothetical protein Tsubulata_022768 [Turnera subulata]